VLEQAGQFGSMAETLSRMRQVRTYFYSTYQDDWPIWLEAAGLDGVEFVGESVFHLQLTSLEAALNGLGIAMGRTPLVDADLARGTLVQPFPLRVAEQQGEAEESRTVSRVGARPPGQTNA
jgi:LysR family glycine cleavage system transcriptional activator